MSKSATGNVRCSCCGQNGYFGPSEEQWSLNVTCPYLTYQEENNLHNLMAWITFLTFPHGTDVQMSSYSATCVHISQGLDKDIFFKKGGWFCRRCDRCYSVYSQWMGQKFNFKSNDSGHVGLLQYHSILRWIHCAEKSMSETVITFWLFVDIRGFGNSAHVLHGTYYGCTLRLHWWDKVRWRPGPWQR